MADPLTMRRLVVLAGPAAVIGCDDDDGAAEGAYLDALPRAVSYRLESSSLSLLTAEDTFVAIYQRAP